MGLPNERGPSLLERLVGASVWLLMAIVALTVAVELLRDIWPWLLGLVLSTIATLWLFGWWRYRTRGW